MSNPRPPEFQSYRYHEQNLQERIDAWNDAALEMFDRKKWNSYLVEYGNSITIITIKFNKPVSSHKADEKLHWFI
jgi:1,2-phenylacetyl-CoA epoxidase catalytic subunit